MSTRTEQEAVAEILDKTRKLTRYFLSKLDGVDPLHQIVVGEHKLNCITWICAHVTWAEHELVVRALGGEPLPIPWLEQFKFGTSSEPQGTWPTLAEIREDLDKVHEVALNVIRAQTDLGQTAQIDLFGPTSTKRDIVYHSIRHEGTHAGHLSWLCKLNGIKTI